MLNTSEHSRIKGGIKIGYLFIAPVNRHGILGQIIGSDAEEVRFLCKNICNQGSCRCLHHNAHLDVLVVCNALFIQFLLDFLHKRLCLTVLFNACY